MRCNLWAKSMQFNSVSFGPCLNFSSLEAFTSKIQGKTVSSILVDHDLCQLAWLAWFNSGMRMKYDRTCQRSIKIISIEKTFALHKSAQKKHFFSGIFLKESSWRAPLNHLKIENFEKWWVFTLDDTLTERLKESIDVSCLIGRGRQFHKKGAAIDNARSPKVFFVLSRGLSNNIPLLLRRSW